MPGSFTSYSLLNDQIFAAAVKKAGEEIKDLTIPFGFILKDFYRSEAAIFALKSEGAYPAISDAYGARKQKLKGFKYPLLFFSGKLAASVLGPSAEGSVAIITPGSMIFGTNVKSDKGANYPLMHQLGGSKLPMRKFLFIGPESTTANDDQKGRLQRWLGYVNDYVQARARANIGGVRPT